MPVDDPGCVKTPKGRSRRGIVFYRRRGLRVVLQPLATTLVLGEVGHSMRSACPSVLTRPRPTAEVHFINMAPRKQTHKPDQALSELVAEETSNEAQELHRAVGL